MNLWTDDTEEAREARALQYYRSALKGAERAGAMYPRADYIKAGLTPPDKATDEYQPAPLWRRLMLYLIPRE